MVGGQRIQVGLAHARNTVAVTVGPDTYQVAVETGIELRPTTAVQQSQASGGGLCCLTLPLNSLIA
jgi:hypothetical protein